MSIWDLLTTICTSGAVSALVTFTLKTILEEKIRNKYRIEHDSQISILQSKLEIYKSVILDDIARRKEIYPELTKNIRNIKTTAETISNNYIKCDVASIDNFGKYIMEIQTILGTESQYLMRDELWLKIHKYKNLAMHFMLKISDTQYYIENGEIQQAEKMKDDILKIYRKINLFQKKLLRSIAEIDEFDKASRDLHL